MQTTFSTESLVSLEALKQEEAVASKRLSELLAQKKVCLGHDWLTGMRGGERVLEYFCLAFPEAPIAVIVGDKTLVSQTIASHPIVCSPLNKIPSAIQRYRSFLPILPLAADQTKVPPCSLLLTTSHCVAKNFRKPKGAKSVCVCFTPMRYAWTFYEEYFGTSKLKALFIKPLLAALRFWDKRTASRVDHFIAISEHVAKRIRKFYGREPSVVYPPVDLVRCIPNEATLRDGGVSVGSRGDYDLIVSALVPYKRVDLAVKLYTRLNRPLKVVGIGGCEKELRRIAGPSVEIMGHRSDDEVLALYQNCRALLFPGEEDYGIVPLEAQACGKPVIAYRKGGALETVREDVSGVFFDEQTEESLEKAVGKSLQMSWNANEIRKNAERFGPAQFLDGIATQIDKLFKGEVS